MSLLDFDLVILFTEIDFTPPPSPVPSPPLTSFGYTSKNPYTSSS